MDKKIISKNFLRDEKGQMLVEALIAITVLTIGVFGMFTLLNQSLSLNSFVSAQYIASNLAMEGVEVVKNLIDNNLLQNKPWNQGLNNGNYEVQYDSLSLMPYQDRKLKFDSSSGLYQYFQGQEINFKRKIILENIKNPSTGEYDEIKVNSIVSYEIKGGIYEVNVEDHFFNWRK